MTARTKEKGMRDRQTDGRRGGGGGQDRTGGEEKYLWSIPKETLGEGIEEKNQEENQEENQKVSQEESLDVVVSVVMIENDRTVVFFLAWSQIVFFAKLGPGYIAHSLLDDLNSRMYCTC